MFGLHEETLSFYAKEELHCKMEVVVSPGLGVYPSQSIPGAPPSSLLHTGTFFVHVERLGERTIAEGVERPPRANYCN